MSRSSLHFGDFRFPAVLSAFGVAALALFSGCASTSFFSGPPVQALATCVAGAASCDPPAPGDAGNSDVLRLMTVNLAHGRKDGPNQLFQDRDRIRSNLDDVARVIRGVRPHAVALQEADGPSGWSGDFDHVEHLAGASALPYSVRGEHMQGLSLEYGTAICSRLPLLDGASYTFAAAPPFFSKGFVITTMPWPDGSGREVDLVSVHLDFARASVRRAQVKRLVEVLATRPGPFVVMGDFNCDGAGEGSALAGFLRETGLHAFERGTEGLETFDRFGKRLDWILLSPELEFVSYHVLPDAVSDHRAVVSDIVWSSAGFARAGAASRSNLSSR